MKKVKKTLLVVLGKVVKISNENFDIGEGPGGCSLFWHQPKRPERMKEERKNK